MNGWLAALVAVVTAVVLTAVFFVVVITAIIFSIVVVVWLADVAFGGCLFTNTSPFATFR
ncbi:hypothetical protein SDC9_206695 [bioreactor metagenome]|uniref:Uncharacterized protein n=1 Tax=bioreactor metagenome TaxID=1076179 RepID=A0A645J5Q1_9ZZZZ